MQAQLQHWISGNSLSQDIHKGVFGTRRALQQTSLIFHHMCNQFPIKGLSQGLSLTIFITANYTCLHICKQLFSCLADKPISIVPHNTTCGSAHAETQANMGERHAGPLHTQTYMLLVAICAVCFAYTDAHERVQPQHFSCSGYGRVVDSLPGCSIFFFTDV